MAKKKRTAEESAEHDRLFKELLRVFFLEFLHLFLPEVGAYIDRNSIVFLDKEVFTDVTAGESHEVDLVVRAKFRGHDAFFLIHVENQASARSDFPARMLYYFARLHEKYGLPVYPIVIFSYERPYRPEPDRYRVVFPDRTVLDFHYRVIQLNRLNWRDFVRQPNPVAAALMTRMRIAREDRPRVKLECLRLIVTLRLNKAKQLLIRQFLDAYLALSREELTVYDREVAKVSPPERKAIMQIVNEWEARGEVRGRRLDRIEVIVEMIEGRLNEVPKGLRQRIEELSLPNLKRLFRALPGLTTMKDMTAYLDRLR